MKRANELRYGLLKGVFVLMLTLGIFGTGFFLTSTVCRAEGQVTITTPNGAVVREGAGTNTTMVGGAAKGEVLQVLSQVQGSDGDTWYQVTTKDGKTGYVRSDLVSYSGDTSTPAGGEGGEGGSQTPPDVTELNPLGATVTADSGRIYDNTSTSAQALADVPVNSVVTITGQAAGADNSTWYRVSFIAEDAQVEGFIQAESVTFEGELTPAGESAAPDEPAPESPAEVKPYEVMEYNGDWVIYVAEEDKSYSVKELFAAGPNNAKLYEESEKKVKSQKIIIIVLVFLLVAATAGIAFLVFKIRDMMDSAYYSEVENETLRRRSSAGNRSGKKVMQTAGPENRQARPAGARPAAGDRRSAGAAGALPERRPAGAPERKPAGGAQAQRSAGTAGSLQERRTAGGTREQRPAGTAERRPAGATQGRRPVAAAPEQRSAAAQGQRGAGMTGNPAERGSRAAGRAQRPSEASQERRPVQGSGRAAQPKNFMEDDDEFEFEFLNYDGDEE